MKELIGRPGSLTGFVLRIGQWLFAATSIGVMVSASGFSNYTAFCYLIASMGLQVLWSFGLSCLDLYAMRIKRDLQSPILVSLFVVGDWSFRALNSGHTLPYRNIYFCYALLFAYSLVTATLSLAAACSSAGIVILYGRDLHYCKGPLHIPCGRYELSIALAFATWFLIAISSHVMFWILASV